MAEQAVSDTVSGRLGDTEKYVRKALAGSTVGFLTGASGLMMQGASLGKVLSLGFGEDEMLVHIWGSYDNELYNPYKN